MQHNIEDDLPGSRKELEIQHYKTSTCGGGGGGEGVSWLSGDVLLNGPIISIDAGGEEMKYRLIDRRDS